MNIFFYKNSNRPIFWTFHIISFIFGLVLFDLVANNAKLSLQWVFGLILWFLFTISLRYLYRFLFSKPILFFSKILIIIIFSCFYGAIFFYV